MNHNIIQQLGDTPVDTTVLATLFSDIKAVNKKVAELERTEQLIRLKRGLFVVAPQVSGKPLSIEAIANSLYGPSYISMHTALRFYGLIPERVYTIQSITTKHSRTFQNLLGRFTYTQTPVEAFSIGLTRQVEGNAAFIIATPEKALCDLIAFTPGLTLRYKREAATFLEDDLRLDPLDFARFNPEILRAYARVGKKAGSINTLLKLL